MKSDNCESKGWKIGKETCLRGHLGTHNSPNPQHDDKKAGTLLKTTSLSTSSMSWFAKSTPSLAGIIVGIYWGKKGVMKNIECSYVFSFAQFGMQMR